MGICRTSLWTFRPRTHTPDRDKLTRVSKSCHVCRRRRVERGLGTILDEVRPQTLRAAEAALWLGRAPPTRTPGAAAWPHFRRAASRAKMVSSRPIGHTLCFYEYKNPGRQSGQQGILRRCEGRRDGGRVISNGRTGPGFLRGGASEPYEYLSRLTQ